jgi:hypothetical protein
MILLKKNTIRPYGLEKGVILFRLIGKGMALAHTHKLVREVEVFLAAVRNGVIVTKHAFYRFHRAFRTSFDVPKLHYLLF